MRAVVAVASIRRYMYVRLCLDIGLVTVSAVHCKNVWITSTRFWLPELNRTIDDLQLRCPNWVKVTQSFLQCGTVIFYTRILECSRTVVYMYAGGFHSGSKPGPPHHPTITAEWSSSGVPFLDTHVQLENGQLTTDLHVKPTNTHQYLAANSCHKPSV